MSIDFSNIKNLDLENEIIDLEIINQNQSKNHNKSQDKISISQSEIKILKEHDKEILRSIMKNNIIADNNDLDSLRIFTDLSEGGYKILLLFDLLKKSNNDLEILRELVLLITMKNENRTMSKNNQLTEEINQIISKFPSIDHKNIAAIFEEIIQDKYYQDPVLCKDLIRTIINSNSNLDSDAMLNIYTNLIPNMRDDRIINNAYNIAINEKYFLIGVVIAKHLIKHSEMEVKVAFSSNKLRDIVEGGSLEEITCAGKLDFNRSNYEDDVNSFYDNLNNLSNHYMEIKEFFSIEIDNKLDEKSIFDKFRKWMDAEGSEIRNKKDEYQIMNFEDDLANVPLPMLERRISDEFNTKIMDIFIQEIESSLGKNDIDMVRKRHILEKTSLIIMKSDSERVIKILNNNSTLLDPDKNKRILAMAYLELGDYENALLSIRNSLNQTSKNLEKRILNYKKWLEQGYDINELEMNVTDYSKNENSVLYTVHSSLPYVTSGYTTRTKYLTEALNDNGVDVTINSRWGFPSDRNDLEKKDKIQTKINIMGIDHLFSPDEDGFNKYKMEEYCHRAAKEIVLKAMETNSSVLHTPSDNSIGLATAIAAKTLKIPFIYELRGIWPLSRAANNPDFKNSIKYNIMLNLEIQCAMIADWVIVISEGIKDFLIEGGVNPNKITIIPNCVSDKDIEILPKNTELRKKIGLRDKITLGYIGSLVPYEGLDFLIEGINKLEDSFRTKVQLIIIGDGSHANHLIKMVEKLKLTKIIKFTGKVNHEQINEYYSLIDVVVVPRLDYEVCEIVPSLKPLEAMAMRKIVLCSDVGPSRELIEGNSNGILFKKNDKESLDQNLKNIIDNYDNLSNLGLRAKKWTNDNRNWNNYAKEISKIYQFLEIIYLSSSRVNQESLVRLKLRKLITNYGEKNAYKVFFEMTNMSLKTVELRTSSNLFLAILRTIGEKDTEYAVKYSEKYLEQLGDSRSIKSLLSYYKRKKLSKNKQNDRILQFIPEIWKASITEVIEMENDKIRLTEEPLEYTFDLSKLDDGDNMGQYQISGEIISDNIETYASSLIKFEFFDEENNSINSRPSNLTFSKSVGWYSYIRKENNSNSFIIDFGIPDNTAKVKLGVRSWSNKKNIYISSDINMKGSDYTIYRNKLINFANKVKHSKIQEVVFIFSGTTYMQKVRANRPIRLAYEMQSRGIPIIFNYHRWNLREEEPYIDDDKIIQIPIDVTEKLIEEISALDFGNKKKQFMISYPHPCVPKLLQRFKLNGWNVIYDARDDWEEFNKVGQAKWYKKSNEKYIVNNSHHVTAVSWPLASKLDLYKPRNKVEVVPNALGDSFLEKNYSRKDTKINKIGYFGHLTSAWFNWDALIKIANKKKDIIFEIIGHSEPEDLILPKNIILLGPKTHPEINKIAAEWNIGIIPFTVSILSDAVDPIKIYEYLALGLPTISFRMPQIDNYPYVETVETIEEFCIEIDKFLLMKIDQELILEWLENNNWKNRVDVFLSKNKIRNNNFLEALKW